MIPVIQHLAQVMKHLVQYEKVRHILYDFLETKKRLISEQKRTTGKQGMVNGSRLILCCFMLCVLITNPFSYLLNRIHGSDIDDSTELRSIVSSRTLQSASSSNDDVSSSTFLSASWRQLVAWMLNMAICLVCLVKLFVYGEPIVSDVEMQEYDVYKKKADQMMAEVGGEKFHHFEMKKTNLFLESSERSSRLLSTMLRKTLCIDRSFLALLFLINYMADDAFLRKFDLFGSLVNVLVRLDEIDRYTRL